MSKTLCFTGTIITQSGVGSSRRVAPPASGTVAIANQEARSVAVLIKPIWVLRARGDFRKKPEVTRRSRTKGRGPQKIEDEGGGHPKIEDERERSSKNRGRKEGGHPKIEDERREVLRKSSRLHRVEPPTPGRAAYTGSSPKIGPPRCCTNVHDCRLFFFATGGRL